MRKTKFIVVGLVNTTLDFGIFNLLTSLAGFNAVLANLISFSCGFVCSYFLNRNWTFKETKSANQTAEFLKFLTSNLVALLINTVAVWIAIRCLETAFDLDLWLYSALAKIIATLFSLVLNYTLLSRWVFTK